VYVGCGERIVARGLGASVRYEDVVEDPTVLGKAIRTVLDEPGHRHDAQAVAVEMARMPSANDRVATLEALVR
jgi:hypothetical protein